MELLVSIGIQGVNLGRGLVCLAANAKQQTPSMTLQQVVMTFDDGFHDILTAAWPVLNKHHFFATLYLLTGYIGRERRTFNTRACLTWAEVGELQRAGFEIGSHTVTHPRLENLGWAEIERELLNSKTELEQRLGLPVETFAYPYAFPLIEQGASDQSFTTARFIELLQKCGYTNNVTTQVGRVQPEDNWHALKRLPANNDDDAALFCAKVAGDYDWINWPQKAVKYFKAALKPWLPT